jgi:hypothetical protein
MRDSPAGQKASTRVPPAQPPAPAEADVFKTARVAAAAVDKMRDAMTGRGKDTDETAIPPCVDEAASEIAEWLLDVSGP